MELIRRFCTGIITQSIWGLITQIIQSNFSLLTIRLIERLRQAKIPLLYKSTQNFSTPVIMNNNPNIDYTVV